MSRLSPAAPGGGRPATALRKASLRGFPSAARGEREGKDLLEGGEPARDNVELFWPEAFSALDGGGIAGYRKISPYRRVAQGESTTLTR